MVSIGILQVWFLRSSLAIIRSGKKSQRQFAFASAKMNNSNEDHLPAVEQSWIVLDEQGWANSRPPTASPSRTVHRGTTVVKEEEEDDENSSQFRRLGMDRDVREALELAERSLELAGSLDEFTQLRAVNEDDGLRGSPYSQPHSRNTVGWGEDCSEDRYNGRAPPMVKRALAISTDSEHVAFQNIRVISGSDTTGGEVSQVNQSSPDSLSARQYDESRVDHHRPLSMYEARKVEHEPTEGIRESEEESSLLHWMFGLQLNSSTYPLVISHTITLLVGFYLGFKRGATTSVSAPNLSQNPTSLSNVNQ